MRALLIYPTHANCREIEQRVREAGMNVASYPARSTQDTDGQLRNCWNSQANAAESLGFPVVKTVCPTCSSREKCLLTGYLQQLQTAEDADIAICTHKRVEYGGLEELSQGRSFVSIHENPIDLLCPKLTLSEADLTLLQCLIHRIVNEPRFLDAFGTAVRLDDQGSKYHDEELAIRKQRQYQFCLHLSNLLQDLLSQLLHAETTVEWKVRETRRLPSGIESFLFAATRTTQAKFAGSPWQFLLAAATGALSTVAILVVQRYAVGSRRVPSAKMKCVVGIRTNMPPPTITTWFCDATMDRKRLEQVLAHPVVDATPAGHLLRHKKAVQIPRDVTRGASSRIVANLLRGVLVDRPQFQHIGVIVHRPHLGMLATLELEFRHRIVKSTFFGSGEDRSSNDWHCRCDLIVVLGTPRIPPIAIAEYLVQIGEMAAACNQSAWNTVHWQGRTESGERVKVESPGYDDPAWWRAHSELVRAQIVQAVGRGRGVLETGCEVIVLSNEECGLPISDAVFEPFNATSVQVWTATRELAAGNSNKSYLENSAVSTQSIAHTTDLSERRVRELLHGLERRGLVRKVGDRSGWLAVTSARPECISDTTSPNT